MFDYIKNKLVKNEETALKERITVLEAEVAKLEAYIAALEKKLAASKGEKNQETEAAQTQKSPGKREEHILSVMNKTGWSREETIAKIQEVRDRLGITFRDYNMYDFHLVPLNKQEAEYEKLLADKEKKRLKRERVAKKKAGFVAKIVEATGWDEAYAIEKIERAKEVSGSSYDHYWMYRFWELSEEEQKTYFTKRDAVALRRKYNTDPKILKTLVNKDLCCKKLDKFLGRPWMSTANMNFAEFKKKFGNENKIIYKPRSSSGGHGIEIFEVNDELLESVYTKICNLPVGIIEGYLVQHPEMQKLSLKSVNTIRVVTIQSKEGLPGIEKEKVYFLYAGVRMGHGSSYVDNLHSGGMMAAVDVETGEVVTGGVDHTCKLYLKHPDTGADIKGFKIPYFNEAKQLIEKASKDLPGCLGWDIAITENGPVIVEVNTSPGADGLQTPYIPERKGMRYVIEKYL